MNLNIPIIYEDEDVLVIDKPAGLKVHSDDFNKEENTLIDWLLSRFTNQNEELAAFSDFINSGDSFLTPQGLIVKKPGLVHRLDKDTSGVMIIAKNQPAFLFLKNQFQQRQVKKIYRAILSGALKMDMGEEKIITLPIGRHKKDPRKRLAHQKADGKLREAITVFRLLENLGDNYAYVEIEPRTGRTHQIRVHAKAFNHPVIGDSLYNSKDKNGGMIDRQALHAYQLTIKLPSGENKVFQASLPWDFIQALEKLKSSC